MTVMTDIQVLLTVSFPDPMIERLQAVSPRLKFHIHPTREAEELPEGILSEIEVLYTAWVLPEPEKVPNLEWIQFHFAGIDHVMDHDLLRADVEITTLSGASVPQMAEFAMMGILALGHRALRMIVDKREKRWGESRFERYQPQELRGSTVAILGYGSIGREIARLCKAFGAEVLATKKDLMDLKDKGYQLSDVGDPDSQLVDRLYPPQALGSMVEMADYFVLTAPLTPDTRGMVDEKILKRMKPTAYLIDIGRGGVVDHGALITVLQQGGIAGAMLDVYPVEPLPQNSPLWELDNVLLSPHIAGASEHYIERAVDMFSENLRRYLTNEPLLNRYDPQKGY